MDFNAYGYLDRFIDFEYNLPSPKSTDYLKRVLGVMDNSMQGAYLIEMNCTHFNLSLRETNKYVLLSKMIIKSFSEMEKRRSLNYLMHLIFPLYALGLKIKNINDFDQFISANGEKELIEFSTNHKNIIGQFSQRESNGNTVEENLELFQNHIREQYHKLFDETSYLERNYEKEPFFEILSFIE